MKLAYEQMKYYPELLAELKATLDMLSQEPLSPALLSAKNQVWKKIRKAGSSDKPRELLIITSL